ncbi:hypothetical protein QUF76_18035 [Desulfobacterales bacterium HSG16]|nr:hypothetical protein [Desulfobacterales bacterium HSG16]
MSFSDFFSNQARKPSGIFGRFFMSHVFEKGNAELNAFVKEMLSIQDNEGVYHLPQRRLLCNRLN